MGVAVTTKIQEAYAEDTVDLTALLVSVGDTLNTELGTVEGADSVARATLLVNMATAMVKNTASSEKTEGMTSIVTILTSVVEIIKEGEVSDTTDVGSATIAMCQNIQEAYDEESVSYSSLTSTLVSTIETKLGSDESIDIGSLTVAVVTSVSEVEASSSSASSSSTKSTSSSMVSVAVATSINEAFKTVSSTSVKVISVIKTTLTKIEEVYSKSYSEEKTSVFVTSSVLETVNDEIGDDTDIDRGAMFVSITESMVKTFSTLTSSQAMWLTMYSASATAISEGFSAISSTESKTIGTVIVKIISVTQEAYTSSSESSYDYSSLISSIVSTFSSELSGTENIDQGALVVSTVKAISESLSTETTEGSTSVMVMSSVLTSVSETFTASTETTVKVVSFMSATMIKIQETYEAFTEEADLSVNLINNVLTVMDEELDSDEIIERATLYSSTIETISTTFESAFSTSTTNWLGMFASSASSISKSYSSVASPFRKEAGTMVVKVVSVIQEEYDSASSSSFYESGSLISKIVTEMETILSSSTILTDESSFNAGLLIVDVTMGITESIMKSTTTADSGRVMVSSMVSLNTDITESEESSSSADKVDQTALFKKVTTVIMEQFEASSTVAPSTLMVEVTTAVNEQLGSSVSHETETLKFYANTLKAIFSVFKEISSLTEKDEMEAKTIIRVINVFSNTISSSVDAGEIAVATITALVTFNSAGTFKNTDTQATIDVVKGVLMTEFGNHFLYTDEGMNASKAITKSILNVHKKYKG